MGKPPSSIHLLYDYMNQRSQRVLASKLYLADPENDRSVLVWRGVGAEPAKALNIHRNVVYRLMAELQTLACIKKIRHGASSAPSLYELICPPVDHEIKLLRERSIMSASLRLPNKSDRAIDTVNRLIARVTELERRVRELENKSSQAQS